MLVFLYVDDCGVAAPTHEAIDALCTHLCKSGFELTLEGDFSE